YTTRVSKPGFFSWITVEGVNKTASGLQDSIANLQEQIKASASKEKGAEVLSAMLASVKDVHDSMAEDSDIWKELVALMDVWEERKKMALQKAESNPAFDDIAKEWSAKLERASELRKQILNQRAESIGLLDAIESDRELVLAYYDLGQADRALQALQKVSDDLTQMNQDMTAILEQTKNVEAPSVSQQ
ncbi:hypothetical protein, partial [Candidatus Entotheonella palauensis]|uniref:hypothetical protein n=1 Tax=Candidatus Entotheonella palauensis TaxID=93172 RepID=UPI000B7F0F72